MIQAESLVPNLTYCVFAKNISPEVVSELRVPTDVNDDPVTALPSVYAVPPPPKLICP